MTVVSRQAFSPLNYKMIIVGIPIVGYASGTFLTITANSDIANTDVGSDGEIHTNLIANNTSTAKVRMGYDNPQYQLVKAAALAFQTSGVFLPSTFTNINNPLDTIFAANSHIVKYPDETYAMNTADMYREVNVFLHNTIRV